MTGPQNLSFLCALFLSVLVWRKKWEKHSHFSISFDMFCSFSDGVKWWAFSSLWPVLPIFVQKFELSFYFYEHPEFFIELFRFLNKSVSFANKCNNEEKNQEKHFGNLKIWIWLPPWSLLWQLLQLPLMNVVHRY